MSIKLMASAWELNIPSTEKMVLLCLCDYSNDDGVCWPSVPTIARKCSKSHRTVQVAIQWLRNEGYCSWDETPGKPHRFALNPRKICTPDPRRNYTPAESAPPQVLHETPAESAPKPLREPSVSSEAKASSPRAVRAWPCPEGVDPDHWRDFLENRKTKRLTNSETALKGQLRELDRLVDDEWPPGRLVQFAAEKGWGSINDPRTPRHGQQSASSTNGLRGTRPDPALDLVRAARAAENREDHWRAGAALPAIGSG